MRGAETDMIAAARSVAELRQALAAWRKAGQSVALIPTMGALHAGHLALVARGKALCDRVVASIFVNPAQFGPGEDLSRYPRDENGDRRKLGAAGCDLAYLPATAEMYPAGFSTTVTAGPLGETLEGRFRPGHFSGVATVVTKLLLQAAPDIACFGEKDYQQLQIIRRLVRDLDIPVRIEAVETVREADGLALSSRNAYLTPDQRRRAPMLHHALTEVVRRARKGDPAAAAWGTHALIGAGFEKVDYCQVCDAETLEPVEHIERKARVLAAAWLGQTRLIDNLPLDPP
ncbi:MAG TPA: pantoate--beta-alanine ligase [Stellaceae bacterium]|nr:pantoate--beta-alanine ligase [Stellaceae bacterium]